VVAALLTASAACTAAARACAVARPHNQPVAIASETAIILWDEASKTEHFIRQASFDTEARDFGFLVPTPSQPELHEAGTEAFKSLADVTKPRVEQKPRPAGSGGCGIGCSKAAGPADKAMPASGVEVLAEKRVGAFDTKVLKATDSDALNSWLKDNQYEMTPELTAWIKPYVDRGWIVTAFKYAQDAKERRPDARSRLPSEAIRMTFKTDRPVFPYREPEDKTPPEKKVDNRLLRVYFLSTKRVQGTLGEKGEASWAGQTAWANKLDGKIRQHLLEVLKMPKETPPAEWWLTEFEDRSSPRPGNLDLYFEPSADQAPVERPPHIQYVGVSRPDVMSVALAVCLVVPPVLRAWRRRR
jgi:hypothetical protein